MVLQNITPSSYSINTNKLDLEFIQWSQEQVHTNNRLAFHMDLGATPTLILYIFKRTDDAQDMVTG